jgi:hypothetical protein
MDKKNIKEQNFPDFLKCNFNITKSDKKVADNSNVSKNDKANKIKRIDTRKDEFIVNFDSDISLQKNKLKSVLKDKRIIKNADFESEYIADWLVRFNKLVEEFEEVTRNKDEISKKKLSDLIKDALNKMNSSSFAARTAGFAIATLAVSISLVYFTPQFTKNLISIIDNEISNPLIRLANIKSVSINTKISPKPIIKNITVFTPEELADYIIKNKEKIKKEVDAGNTLIKISEDDINGRVAGETE